MEATQVFIANFGRMGLAMEPRLGTFGTSMTRSVRRGSASEPGSRCTSRWTRGVRIELVGAEQAETRSTFPSKHSLELELSQNPSGHLATDADETRQVGTRQQHRGGEEQVPMPRKNAENSPPRILMEKAVHLLRDVVQELGHLLDDQKGERRVRCGESADLRASPDHDITIGEGDEVDA